MNRISSLVTVNEYISQDATEKFHLEGAVCIGRRLLIQVCASYGSLELGTCIWKGNVAICFRVWLVAEMYQVRERLKEDFALRDVLGALHLP